MYLISSASLIALQGIEIEKNAPILIEGPKIDKYLLDMLQKPELLDKKIVVTVTLRDQSQNEIARKIKLEYDQKISPHRKEIKKIVKKQKKRKIEKLGKGRKSLSRDQEKLLPSDFTSEEFQAIKSRNEIIEQYVKETRYAIKNNPEFRKKKAQSQEPIIKEIKKYKGKILGETTSYNSLLVEIPLKHIQDLASKPEIASISSTVVQSNLTLLDRSTYAIGADTLWTGTYPRASPVYDVAIADTGVDTTHPALKYRYDGNTLRSWYQTDFSTDGTADDLQGHGTHVAGIVGSSSYAESEATILSETFEGSFPQDNGWSVGDLNPSNGLDYWDDTGYRAYSGGWSGWSAQIGSQTTTTSETIFTENFEGSFPGNNWLVGDSDSSSGYDYWGASSYRRYSGSRSAWAAQIGSAQDYKSGSNYNNVNIPDNNGWVYSPITISGAPSGATVSSMDVGYRIYHTWVGDLFVTLTDDAVTKQHDLWVYEGGSTDQGYDDDYADDDDIEETERGIITFNGKSANQKWKLWAKDSAWADVGYIDYWWIKVYYSAENSQSHKYDNDMYSYMVRKYLVDASSWNTAKLTFRTWYNTESGYDYLRVIVTGDGGQTWQKIGDRFEGTSSGWEYHSVSVPSQYLTSKFSIGFLFYSDGSVTYEGAYVDDVSLTAAKSASNSQLHQYDDYMDAYVQKQVDLTGYTSATLSYNFWLDVEDGYDWLRVQASRDGSSWDNLRIYSEGYDSKDGDPNAKKWWQDSVNLNAYAGSNIYIRFLFHSDYSIHNREGAYLDNIKVTRTSLTTTNYRGVVYDINSMLNAKWIGNEGGTKPSAKEAIDWTIYDAGDTAEVVSNSWGWCDEWDGVPQNGEGELARFMDAVTDNYDVVLVFAAGNEGPSGSLCTPGDYKTLRHPADAYNAITVGASDDRNTNDRSDDVIASYSSRGPTDDGRKKPDITAPGSYITSTAYNYEGSNPDFVGKSGTSMAAPHVSGVAVWFMTYGLSPLEVKALLINTAEDKGTSGWDEDWGWGYLDTSHAYFHKDDIFTDIIKDVIPNGKVEKYYRITNTYPGDKATLVWERHIGYDSAQNNYTTIYSLNDLDLYAYDESTGDRISASISGKDNVEQVVFPNSYGSAIIKVEPWGSSSWLWKNENYALATEEDAIQVNPPSFSASASVPSSADVGNIFTVSASATNYGEIDAHNVQVTLDLPSGLTIVSGSNPASLGTIAPGQTKAASWTVRADSSGDKSISTTVNSKSYEETFTTTSPTYTINIKATLPDLAISSEDITFEKVGGG